MATDKPRFTITLDPEMLSSVLEYKEANRLSTQSKAIQRLIEIGVRDTQEQQAEAILSPDERALVNDYRELNKEGREYIRQTMAMAKRSYVLRANDLSDVETAN